MTAMRLSTALTAVSLLALSAGMAEAQEQNFKRDRNISVQERPRPDYDPAGLHTGAFVILPKATLGVGYDDNIFATPNNQTDDTVFHGRFEAQARSTWSRHRLEFHGWFDRKQYVDHGNENTKDFLIGTSGQLDITRRDAVGGGLSFAHLTEPRTDPNSPTAAAKPIRYDQTSAYVSGVKEFNRLRLLGRFDYNKYDFKDDASLLAPDQDLRDRTVTTGVGRAEYALSPDTALFVEAAFNKRDYRITPALPNPNRNSTGSEYSVGANFDIGALARGEVQVGYMSQDYDYAPFGTTHGGTFHGKVEWFPTQLVTVTFFGDRTIEDATSVGSSGFVSTRFGVRTDYELLRNLIVDGGLAHEDDDYRGIDRDDKRWTFGVGATWMMNRNVGIRVAYDHLDRDSGGINAGGDYKINRLGVALILQR
jgi:hypothetical protein